MVGSRTSLLRSRDWTRHSTSVTTICGGWEIELYQLVFRLMGVVTGFVSTESLPNMSCTLSKLEIQGVPKNAIELLQSVET